MNKEDIEKLESYLLELKTTEAEKTVYIPVSIMILIIEAILEP